jgi:hypothetical protein
LISQVEKLGFRTLLCTTVDKGALGWNCFGWQRVLSNGVTHRQAKRVMRVTGRILNLLLSSIERGGLRGSAYTCIFQKEPAK